MFSPYVVSPAYDAGITADCDETAFWLERGYRLCKNINSAL